MSIKHTPFSRESAFHFAYRIVSGSIWPEGQDPTSGFYGLDVTPTQIAMINVITEAVKMRDNNWLAYLKSLE